MWQNHTVSSLNTILINPSVVSTTTTDYDGNYIYENGSLKRILLPEGYWQGGTYYYYLKDHLGDNRVTINSSGAIIEKSHYYPSGMRFFDASTSNSAALPYRYNGKELEAMNGLNQYDYGARRRGAGLPMWTALDPLAEDNYEISPYAYCADNSINNYDPDGQDYWSTNDPAEIARLFNSLKLYGGSSLSNETFQYGNWNHVTDAIFTGNLTYNDQNKTFYSSYGTVENGESVIHGIKIKASADSEGSASVETARGRWCDNASGKVENTYPEAAVLAGGTKAGWAALKWLWNTLTARNISTTNTFNANASKNVEKMGKAKGNMTGNREVQNQQARAIAKEIGLKTKQEIRKLHDLISGQGYSYQEALREAKAFFNK